MEVYTACLVVYCSGVGTIATITALAAATLRANINIHSLLIAQAGLVSWERGQLKQPLLHQSHIYLHAYISAESTL